jgi:hypothetical protein
MRILKFGLVVLTFSTLVAACSSLQNIGNAVLSDVPSSKGGNGLTTTDIIKGLKEALTVGTSNAVTKLNKPGGYFTNSLLKIKFPKEAEQVALKLRSLGMNKLVDDFEKSMNTAAEKASIKAKPIFVNAITSMSITDAKGILTGGNNAATTYFKSKTQRALKSAFRPEISKGLNAVNATKYWSDITSTYNRLPMVTKVNTDLASYVTDKALDGLFYKVAQEELKIRENPSARVSEILRKVFG